MLHKRVVFAIVVLKLIGYAAYSFLAPATASAVKGASRGCDAITDVAHVV